MRYKELADFINSRPDILNQDVVVYNLQNGGFYQADTIEFEEIKNKVFLSVTVSEEYELNYDV